MGRTAMEYPVVKPLHIELDQHSHEQLLLIKRTVVERNKERSIAGDYRSLEGATFKHIIQRGIGMVAREVAGDII
jgi:hypothetical protein